MAKRVSEGCIFRQTINNVQAATPTYLNWLTCQLWMEWHLSGYFHQARAFLFLNIEDVHAWLMRLGFVENRTNVPGTRFLPRFVKNPTSGGIVPVIKLLL
jgi:hypothetical protein